MVVKAATTIVVLLGCAVLAPAAANADGGVGFGGGASMPGSSTVGNTGLTGSLTLTNKNTGDYAGAEATVCNFGDPIPCPAAGSGIVVIPSCGVQDDTSFCAAAGADPGVIALGPTASGAAGTACPDMQFTVTPMNDQFGGYRVKPVSGNVTLPSADTSCRIVFTFDVLKLPSIDAQPTVAGAQTTLVARATQWSPTATGPITASAFPAASSSTINPPPPPPPPPVTPPPPPPVTPPPPPPCVPPPGPAPPGGTLCSVPNTPSSTPKGTAKIAGESGCVTRNFNVTVTGKQIRSVAFTLDGKKLKTLSKPTAGLLYRIAVRPNTLKRGTHTIIAKTTFTSASATPSRSLRVVFQRCARAASAPQFTG